MRRSIRASAFVGLLVLLPRPAQGVDPIPGNVLHLVDRRGAEPAPQGLIGGGGVLVVQSVRLTDNGDNDGFADPNETVQLFLTLRNTSAVGHDGIVVQATSEDPAVECFFNPVISFGALAAGETRESATAFSFRVANVARASLEDELSAAFDLQISGNGFDPVVRPREVAIDLDLNVSGGLLPTSYTEGFEGAGFGTFTTQSLDAGRESLAASDGHRCQYNDPDFVNSNSYGRTQCFLGGGIPAENGYDWHVHGLSSPDGGRAYLGNNALHFGVHPGAAGADTTRLRQLDAIRTTLPVNLGWNGVTSELSFKHQVGLVDTDYVSGPQGLAVDRGVVQIQLANSAGLPVGNWRKIHPYENRYSFRADDEFRECQFDPTDDGNTEDDYFDPADPRRRLGPSSTCAPEFVFSREGTIFFSSTFDPAAITHSTHGPGLQGSRGPGTWVQTKFALDRWRGRRIRVRFLVSSLEIAFCGDGTWGSCTFSQPSPADDGWYIDDVKVTNTLVSGATVTVDTADRSGLPDCSSVCTSVAGSLAATPPAPGEPGQPVEVDASATNANGCAEGVLQFRFWLDDGNGVVGDAGDVLLRDWSENAILLDAPDVPTRYGVEARCSLMAGCADTATAMVTVPCPPGAIIPFGQPIGFDSRNEISWSTPALVDVVLGFLDELRASGGVFTNTVWACLANDAHRSSVFVGGYGTPAPGQGYYYLVRGVGPSPFCEAARSWSTGAASEQPGFGGNRDADLAVDPDACP